MKNSKMILVVLLEYNNKVFHYFDTEKENIVKSTVGALCEVIAEAEAEDVQPINRGKWVDWCNCSICGNRPDNYMKGNIWLNCLPKYCPNCGAEMQNGY